MNRPLLPGSTFMKHQRSHKSPNLADTSVTVLLPAGMAITGHSTSGALRLRATYLLREGYRTAVPTLGVEHRYDLDLHGR